MNSGPSPALQALITRSQQSLEETRSRTLVSDPFDPSRPPHDPTTLPPGAAPTQSAPPSPAVDDPIPIPLSDSDTSLMSVLGPARGGKKGKKAVLWEVIRPLRMPDDLPLLSQSLPAPRQTIKQIRHSHHQLAYMLATGEKQEEAGRLIGYSPSYISILKTDPTFQELIAYYSTTREMRNFDVIDRLRTLGLDTIDELQSRLEDDPSQFSNRELFEQAELTLVKPMAATRGLLRPGDATSPTGGGGIQVNVNFVKSDQPPTAAPSNPTITIDAEVIK